MLAAAVGFPLVPLSALQVLSIDLGSDILPALALGAEPPDPSVMTRPPRPVKERLLSGPVVRRFMFLGAIEAIGVCFAFFWRIHSAHLGFSQFTDSNHTYREARTMTQVGIVVSQFFNAQTVRSDDESILTFGMFTNRRLLVAGGIGLALVSCISYVPILQHVFGTAGLTLTDWLILISFGVALLAADEFRKVLVRRRRARSASPSEMRWDHSNGPGLPARASPGGIKVSKKVVANRTGRHRSDRDRQHHRQTLDAGQALAPRLTSTMLRSVPKAFVHGMGLHSWWQPVSHWVASSSPLSSYLRQVSRSH